MTKTQLQEALKSMGIPFNKNADKTELKDIYDKVLLEKNLKAQIEKAQELDELTKGMSKDEKDAYLESLPEGMKEYALKVFDKTVYATQPATDLPMSEIITNIPVRVIEQMVLDLVVDYPFAGMYSVEEVRNGMKQLFYKDYSDTDNESGFSDVKLSDFNQGRNPVFTEVYNVDTEIHKGMDLLSSMLNDITVSMGLFTVIVNDIALAIARPFAKKMYERVIKFLDTTASYDGVKEIAIPANTSDEDKARLQAKEIKKFLIGLKTPSRTHLKKLPTGATKGLESQHPTKTIYAYVSPEFSTAQNFDFIANVFNIGTVKVEFKVVEEIDFSLLKEYATGDDIIKDFDIILAESDVYKTISHYSATKIVNTPKLKTVLHRYSRIGEIRRKDKILYAFKTIVSP